MGLWLSIMPGSLPGPHQGPALEYIKSRATDLELLLEYYQYLGLKVYNPQNN
jgi:hypothetical protein